MRPSVPDNGSDGRFSYPHSKRAAVDFGCLMDYSYFCPKDHIQS